MIFDRILHVSSINFSVPDDLREFVDQRVARAGFSTPSEYMRHLIREDRKRAAQEQLEALLLEGLDSGASEPWTEADVEEIRAAVRALEETARSPGRNAASAETSQRSARSGGKGKMTPWRLGRTAQGSGGTRNAHRA